MSIKRFQVELSVTNKKPPYGQATWAECLEDIIRNEIVGVEDVQVAEMHSVHPRAETLKEEVLAEIKWREQREART